MIGTLLLMTLIGSAPAPAASGWEPVPLLTAESQSAMRGGGEGAQWPQALAVDSTGQFLLYGTDVGGLFRSRTAGASWEPCNVGYVPRGSCGLAIDPHNSNRCLSVGANSLAAWCHGLYLSTDGAASWKQVLPRADYDGHGDRRDQVAYDPASERAGQSQVAYWSCPSKSLYRTVDGGETWTEVNPGWEASILKVREHGGRLFAANSHGVFVSDDQGVSFRPILTEAASGLDVVGDRVIISGRGVLWFSADGGKTLARLPARGLPPGAPWNAVKISPADPRRMALWADRGSYNWPRFYSSDGGLTWLASKMDNIGAFLPYNARQALFVWSPRQAATGWSFGGDWITRSQDSGATWKWSNAGNNGILVGGAFQFNVRDPDILFFGSQDYNGALTLNGGRTWQYTNISGNGWGGFCYGGYAASRDLLYVGDAPGWGGPRTLKVSRDGGKTWKGAGLNFSGPDVSMGDPSDPQVLFASNLRSADGGLTWHPMDGCDAVLTSAAPDGRMLFGIHWTEASHTTAVVQSSDHGASWTILAQTPGRIADLAFDPTPNRLYAATEGALKYWDHDVWHPIANLPADQWHGNRITSVAIDPLHPEVVYAASHRDVFSTSVSVLRSLDAGASWENLTAQLPLRQGEKDGAGEALWLRVHPKTRWLYVSTSCYGLWKYPPPVVR